MACRCECVFVQGPAKWFQNYAPFMKYVISCDKLGILFTWWWCSYIWWYLYNSTSIA